MDYLACVREFKEEWTEKQVSTTTEGGAKSVLSVKSHVNGDEGFSTSCSCTESRGAAGCGPDFPSCKSCGYTWCCKTHFRVPNLRISVKSGVNAADGAANIEIT